MKQLYGLNMELHYFHLNTKTDQMNQQELNYYRTAASLGLIPDEENPRTEKNIGMGNMVSPSLMEALTNHASIHFLKIAEMK